MNLYERLAQGFPADRTRPCFLMGDATDIDYNDLEAGVAKIAGLLVKSGVEPGDRVMLQAPKSPEAVMTYLAVLMAGAIFVPLNTAYTEGEVDYLLTDAEPRMFVRDAVELAGQARSSDPLATPVDRADDDIAAIVYTSGTTGRSKGAMLTHAGLRENGEALTRLWEFTEEDTLIHALPIFHVHGLFVALHCVLLSGCAMLWLPRFDMADVISALGRSTVMMGVPTFYTRLLAEPALTRESCKNMRLFISGSAPLLESSFEEFEVRTGHRILERYGMSESAIITSNPVRGDRVAGTVGFPLPGLEIRIAGESPGMIEIKGPSLFEGYWRNPEKTREDFTDDGFFITGDIGKQDDDGRITISGRAKDLIISGGYNVYPKEVEMCLDAFPGVGESAVIGIPHPDLGEAVVAVLTGDAREDAVIRQAREQLAAFKVPRRVVTIDELPRNSMGKVQKVQLRATYADVFRDDD